MGRTAIFNCVHNGWFPAAKMILTHIWNHQGMGLLKQFLLLEDAEGRTVRDVAQWDVDRQVFVALLDDFLVQAGTEPPEDQHTLQQRLLQLQLSRFQNPSRPQRPHQAGPTLSKTHFRPGSEWARELIALPSPGSLPVPSTSASVGNESSAASSSPQNPVPSTSTSATSESVATAASANQKSSRKRKRKIAMAVQSLPSASVENESSAASSSTSIPVPSTSTSATLQSSTTATAVNQRSSKQRKRKTSSNTSETSATATATNQRSSKKRKTSVAVQSLPHHCLAAYNVFMCLPPFTQAIMNDDTHAAALVRLSQVSPDDQDGNTFSFNTLYS